MAWTNTVIVAGESVEVGPLSLGALRDLTKAGHLEAIAKGVGDYRQTADQMEAVIFIVAAATKKDPKWVADNMTIHEAAPAVRIVLESSGFLPQAKDAESPNVGSP